MEIWKPIKDFEGLYEVSSKGKVRSIDRTVFTKNGKKMFIKGKELFFTKSKIDKKGHFPRMRVQLWKNNKAYLRAVHRLVANAFIPNPNNKQTVNHIDGNPLNNCVSNLEWTTFSENQVHAYKHGLMKVKRNYFPKNCKAVKAYKDDNTNIIITKSAGEMARRLGVCIQSVTKVCRKNEKLITPEYKCKGYILSYINA